MKARVSSLTCTLIAGPNGGGKSTIYKSINLPGVFINADDIARAIDPENPSRVSLQAGREALRLLDRAFLEKADFCYETTLSSRQSINVMQQARLAGYRVQLVFIILANSELHVQRVRDRVMKGGHDIPADTIRRRYEVAFANLEKAVRLSEEIAIFDNSDQIGPRICIEIREGRIERNSLVGARALDRRIASCVASALGIPVNTILPDAR